MDIGCGSGNITNSLSTQFEHGKIYGIDVDHNMIEFAKQSSNTNSIEYLLTDLSQDWNSIDANIKQLEFKVSMVFSNMCISLVRQKNTFVQNLKKLMSTDARAYFSFPLYPDINTKLKGEFEEKLGGFVKMPSLEGQMQVWTDLFEANGLTVEFQDIQNSVWPHKSEAVLGQLSHYFI